MPQVEPTRPKTSEELSMEWDALAQERHAQIVSGSDISFDKVLSPLTIQLTQGAETERVIDIGCGTGELTRLIARVSKQVVGIDPSVTSIQIAKMCCAGNANVHFEVGTLEDVLSKISPESFSCAVAAMTLMTTPAINSFAAALAEVLESAATFIATLTHPCFWPRYWNYESAPWFDYKKELFVEAPFTISNGSAEHFSTHIHRPLESYLNAFARTGFCLDTVVEPMPPLDVQSLYPRVWDFPRFIGIRWRRAR